MNSSQFGESQDFDTSSNQPQEIISEIVTFSPFVSTLHVEIADDRKERALSQEQFRGEATFQQSTQFINSRKNLQDREVYSSKNTRNSPRRTISKQWQVDPSGLLHYSSLGLVG